MCTVALAPFATLFAIVGSPLSRMFPACTMLCLSAFASCNLRCRSATLSFNFASCNFCVSAFASCKGVGREVLSAITIGDKFGKGGGGPGTLVLTARRSADTFDTGAGVWVVVPTARMLDRSGVLVVVPTGRILAVSGTQIDADGPGRFVSVVVSTGRILGAVVSVVVSTGRIFGVSGTEIDVDGPGR